MLKKISLLIVGFSIMVLVSCKKQTVYSTADEPAVVGYLIPGQPISVKVYQQKGLSDTATYGALIAGLKLTISDGSNNVQLTETALGTYTYNNLSFLVTGKTYTLNFTYKNSIVSASTTMPAKPTGFDASHTLVNIPAITSTKYQDSIAVKYKWNNPDSLYHVLVFKNEDTIKTNLGQFRPNTASFTINSKQDASYTLYYHTLSYIGNYNIILYTVNKEYLNLLTSNASTSSQSLSNPPTNVINGFGIFTAMHADTIKLTLTHN